MEHEVPEVLHYGKAALFLFLPRRKNSIRRNGSAADVKLRGGSVAIQHRKVYTFHIAFEALFSLHCEV